MHLYFFPVSPVPLPAASTTTAPQFAPAAPARGNVLVVDDEESVRHFASAALHDAGRFDAVLLDLTMPKLDGEDTLVALRMIAPTLPVIVMSGTNDQNRAQYFVRRGLADFLPKPFTVSKLVALLDAVIAEANDTG